MPYSVNGSLVNTIVRNEVTICRERGSWARTKLHRSEKNFDVACESISARNPWLSKTRECDGAVDRRRRVSKLGSRRRLASEAATLHECTSNDDRSTRAMHLGNGSDMSLHAEGGWMILLCSLLILDATGGIDGYVESPSASASSSRALSALPKL